MWFFSSKVSGFIKKNKEIVFFQIKWGDVIFLERNNPVQINHQPQTEEIF